MAKDYFKQLHETVASFGTAPTFAAMPRRSLENKGIAGPTAAHVIEEVHVPLNLAYVTFTTGTSAFQNIVGVAAEELPDRQAAGKRVLAMAGVSPGDRILFCYPPLVNVFTKQALDEAGVKILFLRRSSRDAFLDALYHARPEAIMGESAFIKAALEDAIKLEVQDQLPPVKCVMVAGTPLDTDMPPVAAAILEARTFDVYGCQEFGWLAVNGEIIRDDISLIGSALGQDYKEVVVGGLPMGDSFPVTSHPHLLSDRGRLITYRRRRTVPDYEVVVKAAATGSREALERTARTILRIKARVVKIHPEVELGADKTVLWLKSSLDSIDAPAAAVIAGPEKTRCFDVLLRAQLNYQEHPPKDPAWIKRS